MRPYCTGGGGTTTTTTTTKSGINVSHLMSIIQPFVAPATQIGVITHTTTAIS